MDAEGMVECIRRSAQMVRFKGRPADTEDALAFSAVAEMSLLFASGSCSHDPPLASH